jgi:hypothetical protein
MESEAAGLSLAYKGEIFLEGRKKQHSYEW